MNGKGNTNRKLKISVVLASVRANFEMQFEITVSSGPPIAGTDSTVQRIVRRVFGLVAIVTGALALAFWVVYVYRADTDWQKNHPGLMILFIFMPICVSVNWWENFVPKVSLELERHYL